MRPMWCDNFDMDLLTVIPEAAAIIARLDGLTLKTHGGETFGTLNHPSVWNDRSGSICFFGFDHPAMQPGYWTSRPIIECTALEFFRDLWAHGTKAMIEGTLVWDSEALQPEFEKIMWHVRSWDAISKNRLRLAQLRTIRSIGTAVAKLRELADLYGKLPPAGHDAENG